MHPKKLLVPLGLALTLALDARAAAEKSAVPFRELAFDAACAAAKTEGKVVFIDFYTTWCEPCKRLDQQTWTDAGVGKLVGEKAVALKLDAEKEGKDAATRYKVNLYPTLLVVKPDGQEVDRIEGFREPPAFTVAFNQVLALAATGKSGLEQAKENVANADEGEAQPHFDLAKKLAKAGQSTEALKELTWCWDEGKKDPEFARARANLVARELGALARTYAPAKDALVARRDDAHSRAVANKGGTTVVQDLIALNKELKAEEDTVAVFDQIPAGDRRRTTISIYLFDYFLEKKRYADAVLFNMPASFMMNIELAKERQKKGSDGSLVRYTIASTAKRVEALAGAGLLDQARDLGQKLLELDSSDATKELLRTHTARAGHPELFAAAAKL